jgi:hypothetical protein
MAEVAQHPGAVGAEGDRGADLAQSGRPLEDVGLDAALAEQEGEGQAADTGSDDDHPHDGSLSCRSRGTARAGSRRWPGPLGTGARGGIVVTTSTF